MKTKYFQQNVKDRNYYTYAYFILFIQPKYQTKNCSLPSIHPAVDKWIIHGVTHSQPVDGEIQRLKPRVLQYVRMLVSHDEAGVIRQ